MPLKLVKKTVLAMFTATLTALVLGSCSQYDKLLKSNDNELKYKEAKKYYEDRRYMKAYTLLENVANYYKGTEESDEVLFLIAESYRHNSDYIIANNYYNTFNRRNNYKHRNNNRDNNRIHRNNNRRNS